MADGEIRFDDETMTDKSREPERLDGVPVYVLYPQTARKKMSFD